MKAIYASLIALALCLWAAPSYAQACGPYKDVSEGLAKNFGEMLLATALNPKAALLELWVNPTTRSMTVVIRPKDNPTTGCLFFSGEAFELHEPRSSDKGT